MPKASRVWHLDRESICYRDAHTVCVFDCQFSRQDQSWTVHIHNECVEHSRRRMLSEAEVGPIVDAIRQYLETRRFLGIPIGRRKVHFVHESTAPAEGPGTLGLRRGPLREGDALP